MMEDLHGNSSTSACHDTLRMQSFVKLFESKQCVAITNDGTSPRHEQGFPSCPCTTEIPNLLLGRQGYQALSLWSILERIRVTQGRRIESLIGVVHWTSCWTRHKAVVIHWLHQLHPWTLSSQLSLAMILDYLCHPSNPR